MVAAATKCPCQCNCQWIPLTEHLLAYQCENFPPRAPAQEMPTSDNVRGAIRRALKEGCKKHANVFFYGPNTSGKSHTIQPLAEIFDGLTFKRPVGKGNFPLQGIFGKKVCVLQDVRVNTFKLGFDSLLVWWEGEKFPVPLPQNKHDGDKEYVDKAPVFITAGSKFRIPRKEAETLQVSEDVQNDMMDARFSYYYFPRTLLAHQKVEVPPCPRCFASWLLGSPAATPATRVDESRAFLTPFLASRAVASSPAAAATRACESHAFLSPILAPGVVRR